MSTAPSPSGTDPFRELTPAQRALLRLVCWVAMADGELAAEERQLLERVVARTLPAWDAGEASAQAVQALVAETLAEPNLEALTAALGAADERQLAVKLAFQMACINQRPEDASLFNTAEKRAYRSLVDHLKLPDAEVAAAEWAARQELERKPGLLEVITTALAGFGAWPALEDEGSVPPLGYWL